MKVANVGDPHVGRDLPRDAAQLDAVIDAIIAERCDLVTFAGDLCDRANCCTPLWSTGAVQAVWMKAMARLKDAAMQVICIVGNHDKAGAASDDCLHFLDAFDNVTVARAPRWIRCAPSFSAVFAFPWAYGADAEGLMRAAFELWPIPSGDHSLFLAHVQPIGARMNGGKTFDGGSFAVSRDYLESLPFSRFAIGEFHARQELFPGRGGLVGAMRQQNHGEEGNPQGFEIWDTETNVARWVEIEAAPRHSTTRPANSDELRAMIAEPSRLIRRAVVSGWRADASLVAEAETAGIQVDREPLDVVRERRVEEVPQGIMDDPRGLIKLWASAQRGDDAVDAEEIEALCALNDEIFADKEA